MACKTRNDIEGRRDPGKNGRAERRHVYIYTYIHTYIEWETERVRDREKEAYCWSKLWNIVISIISNHIKTLRCYTRDESKYAHLKLLGVCLLPNCQHRLPSTTAIDRMIVWWNVGMLLNNCTTSCDDDEITSKGLIWIDDRHVYTENITAFLISGKSSYHALTHTLDNKKIETIIGISLLLVYNLQRQHNTLLPKFYYFLDLRHSFIFISISRFCSPVRLERGGAQFLFAPVCTCEEGG